jgi:serpin B
MVVIVPDAGTFKAFEGALSPESLTALLQNMHTNQVNLQLPKFDFETSISAPDPLQSLGMLAPFSAGMADFSGITQSDTLYISDVIHKATITVDEMGTEAAAATAVIMSRTSMPVDEPISLVVDRPFLFAIQHDPSGTLLFLGRVLEP